MNDPKHSEPAKVANEPALAEPSRGASDIPDLTREQLLSALDTQIQFEGDSLRNEGWTRWAIWGAIAGVTWLATELWRQAELSVGRTALVSFGMFVAWRCLEVTFKALASTGANIDAGPVRYRIFGDAIRPLHPELLATTVRHLLIVAALIYFRFSGLASLWVYSLVGAGVLPVMIVCGKFPFILPMRFRFPTPVKGLPLLHLAWLVGTGWQIWILIRPDLNSYKVADFQFGLLVNAGLVLVTKLATSVSSEHLLNHLIPLRQHLAFGRMTMAEASAKAEALLAGVALTDAMHPLVADIRKQIEGLNPLLEGVNRLMTQVQPGDLERGDGLAKALQVHDLIVGGLKSVAAQQRRLNRATNWFDVSAKVVIFYSPESSPGISRIVAEVSPELRGALEQVKNVSQRFAELKDLLTQLSRRPAAGVIADRPGKRRRTK